MGSGRNRKDNDKVIIRRPRKMLSLGEKLSDLGGQVADTCLPSFDQRVNKSELTVQDVPVRLLKQTNNYAIVISGTVIGTLNVNQSAMVTKCGMLGVSYKGTIFLKNKHPYARFIRVSR
jgi:hypothetical protein